MMLRYLLLLLSITTAPFLSTLQAQWQQETQLPATPMTALLAQGDTLYAAGPNVLFISYDAGLSWATSAVIHPQVDYITDLWWSYGRLYVGTVVDGVFVSTDQGQTWTADNSGLVGPGALAVFMFAERGGQLYLATGGSGVFVKPLANNGPWTSFNQGMPWFNVESIVHDQGRLLAGAGGNATFAVQMDNGPWVETPFAPFNGSLNSLLGVIRSGDVLLGAGNQGLYRSDDDGANWTHYNPGTGLLGQARFAHFGPLTLAHLAKPVGFSFLFQTADQGLSWQAFQPAPPPAYGYDLAVAADRLFLAREDGLWRLQPSSGVQAPARAPALACAPNPARSSVKISWSAFAGATVRLTVLDAVGRVVFDQILPDADSVMLNVQSWPAGAYVLRAESSGSVATGRFLIP